MNRILKEVLGANEAYEKGFGDKGRLPMPPARQFAILTCMDARLDPAKYAGLAEGDAHVIRNAGGRVSDDAIRSFVISYKLLGTKEWFVIHHTDCGMVTFTDAIMRNLLAKSLDTAKIDAGGWHDVGRGPARRKASSSTGSRSGSWRRASPSTSGGSATIRWCPATSRSTAISTTSRRAG
jgi:carbonic anhydrase